MDCLRCPEHRSWTATSGRNWQVWCQESKITTTRIYQGPKQDTVDPGKLCPIAKRTKAGEAK